MSGPFHKVSGVIVMMIITLEENDVQQQADPSEADSLARVSASRFSA